MIKIVCKNRIKTRVKKMVQKVIEGVLKFKNEVFPRHEELFSELATGQSPEVLMVTCADSRIEPAMITQTNPGDLFICRNAGNIVPPYQETGESNIASIEFAVAALGVQEIVVCGHTDCGAMKGAINPEGLDALPQVGGWLKHSAEAVKRAIAKNPGKEGKDLLCAVTEQNILLQLDHLKTHPYVANGLNAGKLRLHGWLYDIGAGSIYAYSDDSDAFEVLSS